MTYFQKVIVTIVSVSLGIILLFVGYYFLYTIPQVKSHKQAMDIRDLQIKENQEKLERERFNKEIQDKQDDIDRLEKEKSDAVISALRQECIDQKDEMGKKLEDFINTCTNQGGNTIDFCLASDAGVYFSKALNVDISDCIKSKQIKY